MCRHWMVANSDQKADLNNDEYRPKDFRSEETVRLLCRCKFEEDNMPNVGSVNGWKLNCVEVCFLRAANDIMPATFNDGQQSKRPLDGPTISANH